MAFSRSKDTRNLRLEASLKRPVFIILAKAQVEQRFWLRSAGHEFQLKLGLQQFLKQPTPLWRETSRQKEYRMLRSVKLRPICRARTDGSQFALCLHPKRTRFLPSIQVTQIYKLLWQWLLWIHPLSKRAVNCNSNHILNQLNIARVQEKYRSEPTQLAHPNHFPPGVSMTLKRWGHYPKWLWVKSNGTILG